jgi:MarR family transcriptional regulator, temperature-dependent positive regulator of motility
MGEARMTPNQKGGRLELSPTHLLHRAVQSATDNFAKEVGAEGLTPRQYAVLLTIAQNEGVSQTGLVERTGIDRSTLADVVRRMIGKGLIQRKRTRTDARTYAVKLSEKGRQALDHTDPAARAADEKLLEGLSVSQRKQFVDLLTSVVNTAAEQKAG